MGECTLLFFHVKCYNINNTSNARNQLDNVIYNATAQIQGREKKI